MKKNLLGSSAVALVGAFATSANAAEWNVRVGGYYNAMIAYASTDLPVGDTRDFDGIDVSTNTEIFFLPSITLDNGIKIGANLQLEGETGGDQIDESYVQIKGSFGEVLIGSENSAGYKMTYVAPSATIFALNTPHTGDFIAWQGATGGDTFRGTLGNTYLEVARNNDAKRITYFTPRFSGFQIGLSYARDGRQDNFGPTDISSGSGVVGNIFDIGANYVQTFGDVSVAVSGRYGTGEQGTENPTVWAVGFNLGYAGFTIGGSFAEANDHVSTARIPAGGRARFIGQGDGTAYDIGASYETGPWTFSLTFVHGVNRNSTTNAGGTAVVDDLDDAVSTLGGAIDYKLAKGLRLNGFAVYVDYDSPIVGGDISGFIIGTGIGLSF